MIGRRLLFLNPLLQLFGRRIIECRIGRWHVKPEGGLYRTSHLAGYRLAKKNEWEGETKDTTELDRFLTAELRSGRMRL